MLNSFGTGQYADPQEHYRNVVNQVVEESERHEAMLEKYGRHGGNAREERQCLYKLMGSVCD